MMYEDTLEKPQNALRRAMRRRGQKAVAFSEPMYHEAPAYLAYSDEEEEDEFDEAMQGDQEDGAGQNGVQKGADPDEISTNQTEGAAQEASNGQVIDETDPDYEPRASDDLGERRKFNQDPTNTIFNM
jgi:hypothetical protein